MIIELGGERVRLAGSAELTGPAAELAEASAPTNTLKAYAGHLRRLDTFCQANGLDPWQPVSVADYLAACHTAQHHAADTLAQAASAIRAAYRATGRPDRQEAWRQVIKGARQAIATRGATTREAPPVRLDALRDATRALYAELHEGPRLQAPRAARDRALLLIGFLSGLRKTELVALDMDDVTTSKDGMTLRVRGTKNHRSTVFQVTIGRGRIGRATCPVAAWEDWTQQRPAFLPTLSAPAWLSTGRSGRLTACRIGAGHSIERILHRALRLARIEDPTRYTAHSLRAGLATELSEAGVTLAQVANAGRWDSVDTVLRYARRARRWQDSPLRSLDY